MVVHFAVDKLDVLVGVGLCAAVGSRRFAATPRSPMCSRWGRVTGGRPEVRARMRILLDLAALSCPLLSRALAPCPSVAWAAAERLCALFISCLFGTTIHSNTLERHPPCFFWIHAHRSTLCEARPYMDLI